MKDSTAASFGRRLLTAVQAAVESGVRAVEAALEGVSPTPQAIPVRVRSQRRR